MDALLPSTFPYSQSSTGISLCKVLFTDESDITRYSIELNQDKQVTSITKLYSQTQQKCPELISFIENPSPHQVPLLIRIPNSYNRLKLSVAIKPEHDEQKALIILKSKSKNVDIDQLQRQLIAAKYHNEPENAQVHDNYVEVSKIDFTSLPLDHNIQEPQRIIINDLFNKEIIHDTNLNVFAWIHDVSKKEYRYLFDFSVWIDKTNDISTPVISTKSFPDVTYSAKSPVSQKSPIQSPIESLSPHVTLPSKTKPEPKKFKLGDFKREFNFSIEDGPDFRSTLSKYEASLPVYTKTCSNLADELRSLDHSLKRITQTKNKIIELVHSLAEAQFTSLVKQSGLPKDFEHIFRSLFDPLERNLRFFLRDVCDVKLIQKINHNLSSNNLNSTEGASQNELLQKKKQFESNSKEFYNWLNKYLSNEKDRPELKLLAKRKSFELSKFDYLNHLNMIGNNQYSNQVLEKLFKFVNLDYDPKNPELLNMHHFVDPKLSQDLLLEQYQIYLVVLLRFNSEKYQFRQMIEACQSNVELTNIIRYNKLNNTLAPFTDSKNIEDKYISKDNLDVFFSNAMVLSTSAADSVLVPPIEDNSSEISGILFTLGGQGKQGWHKEWVVLYKGRLIEYSDWRKGTIPINKPIELALSNVKPINYDKRQFCFEIFTSLGHKHVFQAINDDERNKWIKALYNAGQVVDTSRLKRDLPHKHHQPHHHKANGTLHKIHTDFAEKPIMPGTSLDRSVSPISIKSRPYNKEKNYLSLVRSVADSDNHICLDCGSTESVEWISINFLVCFCMNCASCHRNLGTHITKIRSLKLDKFENEAELLLTFINNRVSNSYLEQELKTKKPTPNSSYEEKMDYIRNKYAEKKYLGQYTDPTNQLIRAIQKIEVPNVLRAIISGGDLNITIRILVPGKQDPILITIFEYSLRKYIELNLDEPKKLFAISELLVLNGCNLDKIKNLNPEVKMTDEALDYWKTRKLKYSGS